MISVSTIYLVIQGVPNFFMPFRGSFEDNLMVRLTIFIVGLNLIFSVVSFIVWVMPEKLKRYLNRNYEIIEEIDLIEDDLIASIKEQLSKGRINGNN